MDAESVVRSELSFETKTSLFVPITSSYAPLVVGKSVDIVYPATYTLPEESISMAYP